MAERRARARCKGAGAGFKGVKSAKADAGEKLLAPAQCRTYMRRTLAREFRGIVDGFVEQAKSGSCQHVKLATELLEPKRRAPRAAAGQKSLESLARAMHGMR